MTDTTSLRHHLLFVLYDYQVDRHASRSLHDIANLSKRLSDLPTADLETALMSELTGTGTAALGVDKVSQNFYLTDYGARMVGEACALGKEVEPLATEPAKVRADKPSLDEVKYVDTRPIEDQLIEAYQFIIDNNKWTTRGHTQDLHDGLARIEVRKLASDDDRRIAKDLLKRYSDGPTSRDNHKHHLFAGAGVASHAKPDLLAEVIADIRKAIDDTPYSDFKPGVKFDNLGNPIPLDIRPKKEN